MTDKLVLKFDIFTRGDDMLKQRPDSKYSYQADAISQTSNT